MAALLSCGACGGSQFVAGTAASGDGGGGGASDGGLDATSPLIDGGPGSSLDASDGAAILPDGGDKSKDAGDGGGDGAAPPFTCTTETAVTVLFCADFDETNAPPWNWSLPLATAKGENAVDTTEYVSPPNAYAATTQALDAGDTATFAELQQHLTTATTAGHVSYAFEVFVKQTDPTVSLSFARLVLNGTSSTPLFLDLLLDGTGLTLRQMGDETDAGTPQELDPVTATFATGQWVHVELLVDRSLTQWTVSVLLDGATALAARPTILSPSTKDVEVDLGLLDVVPPSAMNALSYDDVLVRAY